MSKPLETSERDELRQKQIVESMMKKRTKSQCLWGILKREVLIKKSWKQPEAEADEYEDDFIPAEEGRGETLAIDGIEMTAGAALAGQPARSTLSYPKETLSNDPVMKPKPA